MPTIPLAGKGGSDAARRSWIARHQERGQEEALIAAAFRAGIVIAATPITTQPRPIQAAGVSLSPRKATPRATPIGTRK
jgi:hypothetical protein